MKFIYKIDEIITTVVETTNNPNNEPRLFNPFGISMDLQGNILVADNSNHRIRRINAITGIITTLAGTGTASYNGDNQLATNAHLNNPFGISVDLQGNILVADYNNHRIRRVNTTSGIITTLAGTGTAGYNGDNQLAINAQLFFPSDVSVDLQGNILVADTVNHRIRRINATTGIITTLAGNGTAGYNGDNQLAINAQLNNPFGVSMDLQGNILVADNSNSRIRRINAISGIITTLAGNGIRGYGGDNQLAINAQLNNPFGISVDLQGNILVADRANNRIRRINAISGIITTLAGNGTAGYSGDNQLAINAQLNQPSDVSVDIQGNILIVDTANSIIRKISTNPSKKEN